MVKIHRVLQCQGNPIGYRGFLFDASTFQRLFTFTAWGDVSTRKGVLYHRAAGHFLIGT